MSRIVRLSCLLVLLSIHWAQSAPQVFDVTSFGAKADGTFLNTDSIAKAIDDASKASDGGVVHFPKGASHYLTGPIHFKSGVTLQLDAGVVIKFSDNFDHYLPMVEVRWEGTVLKSFSPLIYANGVKNIGIKGGEGSVLDGSGKKWWDYFIALEKEHAASAKWTTTSKWQEDCLQVNAEKVKHWRALPHDEQPGNAHLLSCFHRPAFFQVMHSSHITVEGVAFHNSPFWTVQPTFADQVKIDRVTIKNPQQAAPNTDGINPDSSTNVAISNCHITTETDCIGIKSGRNKEGRTLAKPSENITISDTVAAGGNSGLKIGSEMSGGVRHIRTHNLKVENTAFGIYIGTTRGRGGLIEDLHLADITLHNIAHEGIVVNPHMEPSEEEHFSARTPQLKNIRFENVNGDSVGAGIRLAGLNEAHLGPIELIDIHLTSQHDMAIQNADQVLMSNVTHIVVTK